MSLNISSLFLLQMFVHVTKTRTRFCKHPALVCSAIWLRLKDSPTLFFKLNFKPKLLHVNLDQDNWKFIDFRSSNVNTSLWVMKSIFHPYIYYEARKIIILPRTCRKESFEGGNRLKQRSNPSSFGWQTYPVLTRNTQFK